MKTRPPAITVMERRSRGISSAIRIQIEVEFIIGRRESGKILGLFAGFPGHFAFGAMASSAALANWSKRPSGRPWPAGRPSPRQSQPPRWL